jgi:uncharacterized protein YcfL
MRTLFFIAISAFFFASCGENKTAEVSREKKINGDSLLKVVNDFDANVKGGTPIVKMSREQLTNVVKACKELALITTDRNTQVMYFEKAGSISGEAHFNQEVKSCFENAFALENDKEKLAELHYTYAFINDAKLKQFDIARQEYQLLITDFSTSFWAEQAKMALEVLGKTDEEILELFKAKNQAS